MGKDVMQPIRTLDEFFQRSGATLSLYHMGRRVTPCPIDVLRQLENAQSPWPEPWQGQARVAVVFRLGDMPEPAIWFLALPLDEEGHLVPAQRDAFLNRLLETLGRNVSQLGQAHGSEVDNLMKDNPLAFTPSLPFQAVLHARASHDLGQPASQHLEPVEAYLSGQQAIDWRALGLQGLADYCVRLDEAASRVLAERLPLLPNEVLTSLCYCLEHVAVNDALASTLRARGEAAAAAGDIEGFCACVRAMGGAGAAVAGPWFDALLADADACGPDLLAAIAGRGWRHLEDAERLPRFLERLASCETADFMSVARDLALVPRLRLPVLMTLREATPESPIGRRLATLSRDGGTAKG